MRKQDRVTIADPLVKVDRALCGFGGEIRSGLINSRNVGGGWNQCCGANLSSPCELKFFGDPAGIWFLSDLQFIWMRNQNSPSLRRVVQKCFIFRMRKTEPTQVAPSGSETFRYPHAGARVQQQTQHGVGHLRMAIEYAEQSGRSNLAHINKQGTIARHKKSGASSRVVNLSPHDLPVSPPAIHST